MCRIKEKNYKYELLDKEGNLIRRFKNKKFMSIYINEYDISDYKIIELDK